MGQFRALCVHKTWNILFVSTPIPSLVLKWLQTPTTYHDRSSTFPKICKPWMRCPNASVGSPTALLHLKRLCVWNKSFGHRSNLQAFRYLENKWDLQLTLNKNKGWDHKLKLVRRIIARPEEILKTSEAFSGILEQPIAYFWLIKAEQIALWRAKKLALHCEERGKYKLIYNRENI